MYSLYSLSNKRSLRKDGVKGRRGQLHLVLLVPIVAEDFPDQRAPEQLRVSVFDLEGE